MVRSTSLTTAPRKTLGKAEITAGIGRLNKRIDELRKFDVSTVNERQPSALVSLEKSIDQTLDRVFGSNTSDYKRYAAASSLTYHEFVGIMVLGGPPTPPTPIGDVRAEIAGNIERAITLLSQAIEGLTEDLADLDPKPTPSPTAKAATERSTKIFIVHGHAEGPREAVARFLHHMGFQAIILHEQSNGGRTVIEKIEHHGNDVGFAVVLLTPDDIGGKQGDEQRPRARQNVILELGYFIGKHGRDRVYALKSGEIEVPSDFGGVAYQDMDSGGGWKFALARELNSAGYVIDWARMADA